MARRSPARAGRRRVRLRDGEGRQALAARMQAPSPRPDTARAELGNRAVMALAEEHFEPDLAIRERAHQAEARARRRPGPFLTPTTRGELRVTT